jgi:hypothetical protein
VLFFRGPGRLSDGGAHPAPHPSPYRHPHAFAHRDPHFVPHRHPHALPDAGPHVRADGGGGVRSELRPRLRAVPALEVAILRAIHHWKG